MHKKGTLRLKGGGGGGTITKLIFFCEHYNSLPISFITNVYLLLACLYVGFLYIQVQKLMLKKRRPD